MLLETVQQDPTEAPGVLPSYEEGRTRGDIVSRNLWYLPVKLVVEYLLAIVLFVLALPVMVVTGLIVRLTSPGPALYTQTRLGKWGRPYTIYKIRTMQNDCEKKSGAQWASVGDPRVTRFGRFLRASHLDELPQLWNVLRGEMGLVGPRPERPEFVPTLARAIPRYWERLAVRPGVTGLAQIQVPPDRDLDGVRRKLRYDLYYIEHANPWLDFQIVAATGFKVFGIPFAFARLLLGIPSASVVEADDPPPSGPAIPSSETKSGACVHARTS